MLRRRPVNLGGEIKEQGTQTIKPSFPGAINTKLDTISGLGKEHLVVAVISMWLKT
jgi:hypothetical protein